MQRRQQQQCQLINRSTSTPTSSTTECCRDCRSQTITQQATSALTSQWANQSSSQQHNPHCTFIHIFLWLILLLIVMTAVVCPVLRRPTLFASSSLLTTIWVTVRQTPFDETTRSAPSRSCCTKPHDTTATSYCWAATCSTRTSRRGPHLYRAIHLLRSAVLGDRPVALELLSDGQRNFPLTGQANYLDPNVNVALPIFSIHGNHDDPAGVGQYSPMDILHEALLINYFVSRQRTRPFTAQPAPHSGPRPCPCLLSARCVAVWRADRVSLNEWTA